MGDSAIKATYINMFLLAAADGHIDAAETEYLKRFEHISGITPEQGEAWRNEAIAGSIQFRPIGDGAKAKEYLGIIARMVRVDGEFSAEEQQAYLAMGKALGFTYDELGETLREYWSKDPLEKYIEQTPPVPEQAGEATVLIIEDDMFAPQQLKSALGDMAHSRCAMDKLAAIDEAPVMVVFHAADDRTSSSERLYTLKQLFVQSKVAFIARRDQAPQIGYLLDKGADRCFVEPLYPNEIVNAVNDIPRT